MTTVLIASRFVSKVILHPTPRALAQEYALEDGVDWNFLQDDRTKTKMDVTRLAQYIRLEGLWGFFRYSDKSVHIYFDPDPGFVSPEEVVDLLGHEFSHAHITQFPKINKKDIECWEEDFCNEVGRIAALAHITYEMLIEA